jgi:hypothetical protein
MTKREVKSKIDKKDKKKEGRNIRINQILLIIFT